MFGVVSFVGEDGALSVVPYSWVVQDGSKCYWPPFTKQESIDKAVIECTPASASWQQHAIRLMTTAG